MAARNKIFKLIYLQNRTFSNGSAIYAKHSATSGTTTKQAQVSVNNVTGLSNNVLSTPKDSVGPGASKNSSYKNPEYFCYHNTSYFEAEIEMAKYRLPQPSSLH